MNNKTRIDWLAWKDDIERLIASGCTYQKIADFIHSRTGAKYHKESVKHFCKKHGIKSRLKAGGVNNHQKKGVQSKKRPEVKTTQYRDESGYIVTKCPDMWCDTIIWGRWVR